MNSFFKDIVLTLIQWAMEIASLQPLTHLLPTVGFFRSIKTLREEIVRYLQPNPNSVDGVPLEMFAGIPWEQYHSEMGRDGTYGDQLTLQAFIFNIQLIIISSLGHAGKVVISPWSNNPIAQFTLGHFAETEGTHYVCLQQMNGGEMSEYVMNIVEMMI